MWRQQSNALLILGRGIKENYSFPACGLRQHALGSYTEEIALQYVEWDESEAVN